MTSSSGDRPNHWSAYSTEVELASEGVVDVIRFPLVEEPGTRERFRSLLDPNEQKRAARYKVERATRQFIVGRGSLRVILGSALGIPPAEVRFEYEEHGRPTLPDAPQLKFNLTHSHEMAICALTKSASLGVDLEWMRSRVATESVAKRYFAPAEVKSLLALPVDQRTEGFFQCWTRKEAYLKAMGAGLTFPLREFEVSLGPGRPAEFLRHYRDPVEAERWSFVDLSDPTDCPGYVAHLILDRSDLGVRRWHGEPGWDR